MRKEKHVKNRSQRVGKFTRLIFFPGKGLRCGQHCTFSAVYHISAIRRLLMCKILSMCNVASRAKKRVE